MYCTLHYSMLYNTTVEFHPAHEVYLREWNHTMGDNFTLGRSLASYLFVRAALLTIPNVR